MSPSEIQQLFDYNAWANRRVLAAAEKLTPAQFTQTIPSSFSSVRDTLAHIYAAETIWLERFQGGAPAAFPATDQFSSVAILRDKWLELEQRVLTFARGVTQSDLDRTMEHKAITAGGVFRNKLWESMLHFVNHGTYHRGQVTTMLRQLGAETVSTDLIRFFREQAQATSA